MNSADWPLTLLKALGLGVLAFIVYVAFFLYATETFWRNSEVTVTSEQQDGISVSLTHPTVVKGGGSSMTMTMFNHTSEPVTVAEPFFCFFGTPSFVNSRGQVQQTTDILTCPTIGMPPITIPARSSESGEVWLYMKGLPADTYKVTYDISLNRLIGWNSAGASYSSSEVTLTVRTQVRVVPWWQLF